MDPKPPLRSLAARARQQSHKLDKTWRLRAVLGVGCRPKLPCSVPAEAEVKLSVRAFPQLGPQEDRACQACSQTHPPFEEADRSERGPERGTGSLRTRTRCCLEKTWEYGTCLSTWVWTCSRKYGNRNRKSYSRTGQCKESVWKSGYKVIKC